MQFLSGVSSSSTHRVLVTGACGFAGSQIIRHLVDSGWTVLGMDNFCRPGAEINRLPLQRLGVRLFHGDVRQPSDFECLPDVDWLIDAAANPSVLAGLDGRTSSRQLLENNLVGTLNMLEFCRARNAGFLMLSTSRVYSVDALRQIPLTPDGQRFRVDRAANHPGVADTGITEAFSTQAPLSLYGTSKLCSEQLALEYHAAFGFPVWINRCGVLAGPGQFGRPDQGIVAYWIHSWSEKRPLRYLGFGGDGLQVRDALHPQDLARLLVQQMQAGSGSPSQPRLCHVSGGLLNSFSLAELSAWCRDRFPGRPDPVRDGADRAMDVAWLILDSDLAHRTWNWAPQISRAELFEGIAAHADAHPDWISLSAA